MAGLRRRILGITVISAGVCAALPFRNEGVNPPAETRQAAEFSGAPASRNELTLQLTLPTTSVVASTTFGGQQPISAVAKTDPTPQPQRVRRDELQAPPSIASEFEPLVARSAVATFPVAAFPVATAESTLATRRGEAKQRHRITDGDTLGVLAERYLGDRNRWLSIFEANDGLLTDPNILPIGKEILIPQVRNPSPDDADDHLVPIPPGLLGH